jgi:2-dehydro-3-deoxygalactonokinase
MVNIGNRDERDPTRLIGIDWGSTSVRAFRIGDGGIVLASRSAPLGSTTMNGDPRAYASTLANLAADWLIGTPLPPILACGMVGSKHGWREASYADCPADADALAARTVGVRFSEQASVSIVPGLQCRPHGAAPDVMRGEETQIIGALMEHPELHARSCMILPGTHSKWAHVDDGRVQGFATHMTGELFEVLRTHSVLGRLMLPAARDVDEAAFSAGIDTARSTTQPGLAHQLFSVRTLGLNNEIAPESLPDYLSGLLIGHELQAGFAWRRAAGIDATPLVLIGEPRLCERYVQALQHFDIQPDAVLPNTVPAGLWQIATALGLVQDRTDTLETR